MDYQNLKFLQDTFYITRNICSWSLTTDGLLLYSNCPEQEFFYDLFSVSRCRREILQHFSENDKPLIASDSIGFVWISALQKEREGERGAVIHLIGPVFTSAMTEQYIRKHAQGMRLSPEMQDRLWGFLKGVPAISLDMASSYAAMLHYGAAEEGVAPEEIRIWNEAAEEAENVEDAEWGAEDWHGDWTAERQFFESISEGRFVDLSRITTGKIGSIGGGDPLRQAKNQLIIFSVLCSRASIIGGVSVEGALSLSDFFINRAEAASTVPAVEAVGMEMYRMYIQRVQKAKESSGYSPLIRACSEYVETHIFEKIRLADMAASAGYTESYISRKFKKETGESLFDYINRRKVELAKRLLRESPISVSSLSDRLAFASPSYFSSVFRKYTGMCPVEYQTADQDEQGPVS